MVAHALCQSTPCARANRPQDRTIPSSRQSSFQRSPSLSVSSPLPRSTSHTLRYRGDGSGRAAAGSESHLHQRRTGRCRRIGEICSSDLRIDGVLRRRRLGDSACPRSCRSVASGLFDAHLDHLIGPIAVKALSSHYPARQRPLRPDWSARRGVRCARPRVLPKSPCRRGSDPSGRSALASLRRIRSR